MPCVINIRGTYTHTLGCFYLQISKKSLANARLFNVNPLVQISNQIVEDLRKLVA